jgi:hypothetical protein
VSPKNLALLAGTFAILAAGVYLFFEVKATPAEATPSVTVRARPQATVPREDHTQVATTTQPTRSHTPTPPTPRPPLRTTQAPIERVPPPEDQAVDLKTDNLMELANKAYDRQDFDEATTLAMKVLAKEPDNVRMLRVMVSANCIGGDSGIAQTYYEKLPKFDRDQMKQRCDRYGVVFKDPPGN